MSALRLTQKERFHALIALAAAAPHPPESFVCDPPEIPPAPDPARLSEEGRAQLKRYHEDTCADDEVWLDEVDEFLQERIDHKSLSNPYRQRREAEKEKAFVWPIEFAANVLHRIERRLKATASAAAEHDLGAQIAAIVREVLAAEQRPGGLLSKEGGTA